MSKLQTDDDCLPLLIERELGEEQKVIGIAKEAFGWKAVIVQESKVHSEGRAVYQINGIPPEDVLFSKATIARESSTYILMRDGCVPLVYEE